MSCMTVMGSTLSDPANRLHLGGQGKTKCVSFCFVQQEGSNVEKSLADPSPLVKAHHRVEAWGT